MVAIVVLADGWEGGWIKQNDIKNSSIVFIFDPFDVMYLELSHSYYYVYIETKVEAPADCWNWGEWGPQRQKL